MNFLYLFHVACALILLGVAGLFAWTMYSDWRDLKDEDRNIGHLIAMGGGSATKTWTRIVGLFGTLLGDVSQFAFVLDMPQFSQFIQDHLKPEYVSAAFLTIAVVGALARSRTQPAPDKSVI